MTFAAGIYKQDKLMMKCDGLGVVEETGCAAQGCQRWRKSSASHLKSPYPTLPTP